MVPSAKNAVPTFLAFQSAKVVLVMPSTQLTTTATALLVSVSARPTTEGDSATSVLWASSTTPVVSRVSVTLWALLMRSVTLAVVCAFANPATQALAATSVLRDTTTTPTAPSATAALKAPRALPAVEFTASVTASSTTVAPSAMTARLVITIFPSVSLATATGEGLVIVLSLATTRAIASVRTTLKDKNVTGVKKSTTIIRTVKVSKL